MLLCEGFCGGNGLSCKGRLTGRLHAWTLQVRDAFSAMERKPKKTL